MKISAKTEYACLALLQLAVEYESDLPVPIRTIAESNTIPTQFLVQILLQLKGAGYVTSTRGPSGGYRLAKPPNKISVSEILTLTEGPTESQRTTVPGAREILQKLWMEIDAVENQLLSEQTFADLAARSTQISPEMYYI